MGLREHAGPTLTSLSLAQVRLRFKRMRRYRGMLGQSHALRVAVKRRSGIVGAAATQRKPLETLTRPPLPCKQEAHMSKVFVLDTQKRALDPVHPGWARKLLSSGQAAVFRRYPFTIILKKVVSDPVIQPLRLKLDPGSKTTRIAIVNDVSGEVVFAAELTHRGQRIKASLEKRRA